jgi:hypothetical protein
MMMAASAVFGMKKQQGREETVWPKATPIAAKAPAAGVWAPALEVHHRA